MINETTKIIYKEIEELIFFQRKYRRANEIVSRNSRFLILIIRLINKVTQIDFVDRVSIHINRSMQRVHCNALSTII